MISHRDPPAGMQSYILHPDGSFEVYLSGDCKLNVSDGGYLLRYQKKITGPVGVVDQPERGFLFLWFGINVAARSTDELYSYVGPRCRCGFDCAATTTAVSDS
ncbi:hypothetical protein ZIOFF_026682 [Zingiber officinale]|uniref:Uncharacterized protein n=1 Tax=Zingiber officinale TaxID=94328 RepID=A0A8J5LFZ0_ZINOF|nr:hypothetical protein ZIOFF_026682 [Zingiber officinale]